MGKKKDETVLVLRTCNPDRTSHGGFVWPEVGGTATAPDWDPDPDRVCGGGLHGLLWGCGGAALMSSAADALWQVVAVKAVDVANPDAPGKVRFRSGVVVFEGDRDGATTYLVDHGAAGKPVVYVNLTGGHRSTLTGGHRSTLTGGHRSTLTGGADSTLTGGDYSTLTGGDYSTLTGGADSTLTGGADSTLTGGDYSTLTGGVGSTLAIKWWDSKADRYRLAVGYVGEDGIEANVAYRCDDEGNLVRADGAA